jgi:hypothetical protein
MRDRPAAGRKSEQPSVDPHQGLGRRRADRVPPRPWLKPFGLVSAGALTTDMCFRFVQTFVGPHPPPNAADCLAFNLPWLIGPMVLDARVLGSQAPSPERA